jgi:hypothetical protein
VKQLRGLDWEAIAGIVAAAIALILHLLHVVDEEVLLAVALVLLALLLLRDLHRETRDDDESAALGEIRTMLTRVESSVARAEVRLIGPRDLRTESERFARQAAGEMLWFNVCLSMFEPQPLFDVLLRPALTNPRVTSVQFVLSPSERERWESAVLAKATQSGGAAKLREPRWVELEENISFILADGPAGKPEAHVSFWGEPFMSRRPGRDIPRYVIHVLADSALIGGLIEVERSYR